jgi:hypothetical protein
MTLIEPAKMPDRLTKPSPKRPTIRSPRNLLRSHRHGVPGETDLDTSPVHRLNFPTRCVSPPACFTFTLSCLTVLPSATTLGFRPALAKDCKNTTLARLRQLLRTVFGDSLQFLVSFRTTGTRLFERYLKGGSGRAFLRTTSPPRLRLGEATSDRPD